ncbi:MAG: hypothetical protein QOJ19_537 [Acidimicrobiia bacterium]|nr:hypothetical protein [Acidimicrobiia bacterium]
MASVLVTGASRGIGKATCLALARAGHRVFGTMRDPAKAPELSTVAAAESLPIVVWAMDVDSDDSVRRGVAAIIAEHGPIDALVNNAGIERRGSIEELALDEFRAVMETNYFGAIRCMQAVLPGMRARGSGCIVNISSLVGRMCHIGQSPYYVSKWAMEAMSEGLAQELAPFGVRVAIIEPGVTKSAIFAKNVDAPNHTGAYDAHYRRLFQFYSAGIPQATPPEEVAALIHHAITTDQPALRYACSWGAQEILSGRAEMSDEDWVALGGHEEDSAYYTDFKRHFGVDIAPAPKT